MKKINILLLMISALWHTVQAQDIQVDVSYKYIYARQWDQAIQLYNFSRPFLSEKQPLLMHGIQPSMSLLFDSKSKLQHGIGLSYTFLRSRAESENLDNTLHLHFLNLAYLLHYSYRDQEQGLYSELAVAATGSGLFRRLNGEAFESDDSTVKAWGVGADLNLKTGYRFPRGERFTIAPFVGVGFTPYLFAPKTESVINQTQELISKDHTSILHAQAGIAITF